ncbi:FtsK/SpoIIIE domain-containing protein [Brevibacterium sp. BDJS002]|uniref:FtsK/SpoIIIE domain-containing protein n=1 Tax=Brevibacterium sp. BDJS002 TaxID=3020906 RepID=UPI002307B7A3|nr:FtsK/SpoIIIE domain-containing protein [Brevibacterium sp. BDJS002]WCE39199.1 FtsK/SpoIIIE domain-containing protein [Brevibacterium sp. BDJS002]
MNTLGLIHRIDANANIRTDVIEADSEQPVLEVLRSVIGPVLTLTDLLAGNRLPAESDNPDDLVKTMAWGRWQSLNPVTVLGTSSLDRGSGSALVSVLAGPDSGFTIGIDPRTPLLSRISHPESLTIVDPCLSRQPARLELGPAREQTFSALGTTIFSPISPTISHSRRPPPDTSRTRMFAGSGREPTHVAPESVDDPRPAKPPQWWAFLIPIAIGGVLAVVTGMWWFLLFSVSAPISGYVAYVMEKRRYARDCAQCVLDRRAALETARRRLSTVVDDHRRLLQTGSGLCLGFGAARSPITIADELREGTEHLDGTVIIDEVPLRIDPTTTSVTVTGDSEQLRRMALSWLSEPTYDWLPCPDLLRLPELQGSGFDHGDGTESRIGVVLSEQATSARLLLQAPSPIASISLSLGSLAQARTDDSSAADGPAPGRTLVASLMPPGRFLALGHRQATDGNVERLPNHGLGDLYDDAPQVIRQRWAHTAPGPVRIGRGRDGDIALDLFNDGPHALVAGTTGSGKSILLQTWLLAMALEHPPSRLVFVLIDFKGGATFAPLEELPHTDSVLDDFDSAAAFRALVSVRAEITRRERLLADHGCSDVLELDDPPSRLVVVIDEFHALMATHPKAADLLEHLTALGRSLGVHLILATQRPLGVVTGQMKANINIRMCLRVREDADSFDVIGVNDAALLPPDTPGAACLDTGSSIVEFRVAVPTSASSAAGVRQRPRLRPWEPGRGLPTQHSVNGIHIGNLEQAYRKSPAETQPSPQRHRSVVLPPLPDAEDIPVLLSAWTDGSGSTESDPEVNGTGSETVTGTVTGIVDIPSHQKQSAWSYSPAVDGSTIVVGTDADVVSTVLRRMAASAALTHRVVALGRIAKSLDWAEIACGMDTGWRFHAILDHLHRGSADERVPATIVVCSNWNEFIDSLDHQMAAETERLLKHGSGLGLTFLLGGCRTSTSTSAAFTSQVIFPPSAGGDGLSVGLSRQRFVGTWPEYRAVLVGPSAHEAGGDGADVQLVPDLAAVGDDICGSVEPRWRGLTAAPEHATAPLDPTGTWIPLGLDPFGKLVAWDPARDGEVLSVRGSPQSGKSETAAMLQETCSDAAAANIQLLTVHDDAHLEANPDAFDLLDGGLHVVTMPVRFTPGYGSPLAKAQGLGPTLIIGVHSRQDLSNLGLLRLPPLDGDPGTAWYVTEGRAQAVRLFSAEGSADVTVRSA